VVSQSGQFEKRICAAAWDFRLSQDRENSG
jgi:hypothetical protein